MGKQRWEDEVELGEIADPVVAEVLSMWAREWSLWMLFFTYVPAGIYADMMRQKKRVEGLGVTRQATHSLCPGNNVAFVFPTSLSWASKGDLAVTFAQVGDKALGLSRAEASR